MYMFDDRILSSLYPLSLPPIIPSYTYLNVFHTNKKKSYTKSETSQKDGNKKKNVEREMKGTRVNSCVFLFAPATGGGLISPSSFPRVFHQIISQR
jgi:hypothetical protein